MRSSEKLPMIDPATVQILFADLQPPIVARSKTNPPQNLSCAASVLARCARLLSLPVYHSVVPEGGKAPQVLPELAKEAEGAPLFTRMTADPFLDPQTREAIDAVNRPVLVIAGVATEAVVLHAALSALESDYRVQVPVDACGGLSERTEDAALRQIEAAGGVTTCVVSLVTAMAPDFAQEPGRNTFAALQALRLA
jgi:nicotinamidase-related amidase